MPKVLPGTKFQALPVPISDLRVTYFSHVTLYLLDGIIYLFRGSDCHLFHPVVDPSKNHNISCRTFAKNLGQCQAHSLKVRPHLSHLHVPSRILTAVSGPQYRTQPSKN